jgi:hypothetical protein
MKLIHGIFFGMAVLIGMYLGVKNADGIAKIFSAGGPQVNNTIRSLQGR